MYREEEQRNSNLQGNEGSVNRTRRTPADRVLTVRRGMPMFLSPIIHEIMDQASLRLAHEMSQSVMRYPDSIEGRAPREVTRKSSTGDNDGSGKHTGETGARTVITISPRSNPTQAKYMNYMAALIPASGPIEKELQAMEKLRLFLIALAQKVLEMYARRNGFTVSPNVIDFKCCGSLRSGFMLPNAGLDLVAKIHPSIPSEVVKVCPRILEQAFLDNGFGAAMILNPKVFMIKFCDKPSDLFLDFLRRQAHDDHRGNVSRLKELTFPSGSGAHCYIDFSGRLKLYSAELLRCYALCDERVRPVGLFVKLWARNRQIDGFHNETMCSYGYTLMVIHYLMNIANPPVIPNLQTESLPSGHIQAAKVNGYTVRFFDDEAQLRAMSKRNEEKKNRQSVGELLCGFFAYYSMRKPNSTKGCLSWAHEAISIRTRGGILSKKDKGWYRAQNDANGDRHRYLIAIEDPFELDCNVASAVTPGGLRAMQSEFRRAQTIIDRVKEVPGTGWEWRTNEGDIGKDLLAKGRPELSPAEMINNQWNHADCVPQFCTRRNKLACVPARKPVPVRETVLESSQPEPVPESIRPESTQPDPEPEPEPVLESTQPTMPGDEPNENPPIGFRLDPRQFHGPSAIRDRPIQKVEYKDNTPETSTGFWGDKPLPS